jgi:hypothetical protein
MDEAGASVRLNCQQCDALVTFADVGNLNLDLPKAQSGALSAALTSSRAPHVSWRTSTMNQTQALVGLP